MKAKKPQLNPVLKLVLDLGPLLLFFLANSRPALFLPLVVPILPAEIATGEREHHGDHEHGGGDEDADALVGRDVRGQDRQDQRQKQRRPRVGEKE